MHDDGDDDDGNNNDADDGYIPCPYCGETMLEDAEHCPSCNRWITSEDLPRKPLSLWMAAIIVLCLLGLLFGALRGF
jgi:RNA polymerase subunit RPABC4/transcription elongation factor Spt4